MLTQPEKLILTKRILTTQGCTDFRKREALLALTRNLDVPFNFFQFYLDIILESKPPIYTPAVKFLFTRPFFTHDFSELRSTQPRVICRTITRDTYLPTPPTVVFNPSGTRRAAAVRGTTLDFYCVEHDGFIQWIDPFLKLMSVEVPPRCKAYAVINLESDKRITQPINWQEPETEPVIQQQEDKREENQNV